MLVSQFFGVDSGGLDVLDFRNDRSITNFFFFQMTGDRSYSREDRGSKVEGVFGDESSLRGEQT